MLQRRLALLLLVLITLGALLAPPLTAASSNPPRNISNLTPQQSMGRFWLSPDGRFVAYLAGSNATRRYRLMLAATDGGMRAPLTPGEIDTASVEVDVAFSPDSRFVVFRLLGERADASQLASKQLPNGPVVKLTGRGSSRVQSFRITPDSRRVVFVGAAERNLISVPISGGAQAALTTPGQRIGVFAVAPDSRNVVAINIANPAEHQTFSIPVAGGPQRRLDPGLTAVAGGFIAPNGQRVFIYERGRLFTTAMDGTGLTFLDRLEQQEYQGPTVPPSVQSLPDGSAAFYLQRVEAATVVGEQALMRVTVGGQITRLSTAGADAIVGAFWVDQRGQHVLYSGYDKVEKPLARLFSVPVGGGPIVTFPGVGPNVPPVDEGPPYRLLPDGPLLAYTAFDAATYRDGATDNRRVLYLASIESGQAVELGSRIPTSWNYELPFMMSGDGSIVAWRIPGGPGNPDDLYVTETVQVSPRRVARLPLGQEAASLTISRDGSRLVYVIYTSGPQGERFGDLFVVRVK